MTKPINPNPFVFHWLREDQGYEWMQGIDSRTRLVAKADAAPDAAKLVRYRPLDDKRLFERFADLKPTRASIQQFADRYGDLFNEYGLSTRVRRPRGQYRISQLHGASLQRWKAEVGRMKALVGIWRAIKAARKRDLKDVIVWKDPETLEYRLKWSETLLACPLYNSQLLKRFESLDVIRPAMYLLQAEINKRIADPTNPDHLPIIPRLVWCPGPEYYGIAQPDHHQRLIFEPGNLLSAIWLQFARALTDGYQLQTCAICGEHFQIGKGAFRTDKKTCGPRCRKRLSRSPGPNAGQC